MQEKQMINVAQCTPIEFFENIKDSLRYESELEDRRIKFLLTMQSCIAVGYGYAYCHAQQLESVHVPLILAMLGVVTAWTMLRAAVRSFRATGYIRDCWELYLSKNNLVREEFPPEWGLKSRNKPVDGNLFSHILKMKRRTSEYYVALPLAAIVAWLVVLYFEITRMMF